MCWRRARDKTLCYRVVFVVLHMESSEVRTPRILGEAKGLVSTCVLLMPCAHED